MGQAERYETVFKPLSQRDGYLPIRDFGLLGDGRTAALVGRDGSIPWLCVPRFDSAPLFAGLLDNTRGGAFRLAPDNVKESRQNYLPDTGVLITELKTADGGLVRITDALTLRPHANLNDGADASRGELLRVVQVLHGPVRLRMEVAPRTGAATDAFDGGLRLRCSSHPGLGVRLRASLPLNEGLHGRWTLQTGDRAHFSLGWGTGPFEDDRVDPEQLLDATAGAWRRWLQGFRYSGPEAEMVRRSAITLKQLDYFENGAMVAAPTSSLPESIGGERNWDYRYAWVRDVAFAVYALRGVGLEHEASAFLNWTLRGLENVDRPKVLYAVDGTSPPAEWEDRELEGYRRSAPVRWGNAAVEQTQHDVFGEILDCAYGHWLKGVGRVDERLWPRLRTFVEGARREWRQPDHGIWEVRTPGRPFTYSVALCQVALDRGARLAEAFGLPGPVADWRSDAEAIREVILKQAWSESQQAITEHLDGSGGLDASLLSLPLRDVVPAGHPRMIATANAIAERLGAGRGLLYRYHPETSPDGLPGHEGAFLLCSFWLVDNLTGQGRLDDAHELFESLCRRGGSLGLLPEQIDPGSGDFLGNYPQAFSHVGLISSAINLARASAGQGA